MIDIDIDKGIIKYRYNNGAKSDNFCLFSAYFDLFSPDLLMKYRIFLPIVDILSKLKNINRDIAISKAILKISILLLISIKGFCKILILMAI